ncbi:MAG: G1 family glutamic endopeptidase [Acidimicrobiales bacterium]
MKLRALGSILGASALSASGAFAALSVGGAQAAAAPVIVHAPMLAGHDVTLAGATHATWSSSNWSGYAEKGTFTGVTATWTVPSVSASARSSSTYSASWVGVDGFTNSSLIQTGTEQDYWAGSGHYDAWWEILPAPETQISTSSYPVSPGDRMSASIWKTAATVTQKSLFGLMKKVVPVWSISLSDTSRHWTFSTKQAYSGPGASAEWITEAPQVNGSVATLSPYEYSPPAGTGDFDNAGVLHTVVSSGTPTFGGAGLSYGNDAGVMVQNSAQVSTPGDPDAALTAFNMAYGASTPPTPTG